MQSVLQYLDDSFLDSCIKKTKTSTKFYIFSRKNLAQNIRLTIICLFDHGPTKVSVKHVVPSTIQPALKSKFVKSKKILNMKNFPNKAACYNIQEFASPLFRVLINQFDVTN